MVHVNVGKARVRARGIDKETQKPFVREEYHFRFDLELVLKMYLLVFFKYLEI